MFKAAPKLNCLLIFLRIRTRSGSNPSKSSQPIPSYTFQTISDTEAGLASFKTLSRIGSDQFQLQRNSKGTPKELRADHTVTVPSRHKEKVQDDDQGFSNRARKYFLRIWELKKFTLIKDFLLSDDESSLRTELGVKQRATLSIRGSAFVISRQCGLSNNGIRVSS